MSGALYLVVRGRHVGGIISWGRHDRHPIKVPRVVIKVRRVANELLVSVFFRVLHSISWSGSTLGQNNRILHYLQGH